MNRRNFLTSSTLFALTSSLPTKMFGNLLAELTDEQICNLKFDLAVSQNLAKKPIGEVIIAIGKSFIGTDYVAHTLESDNGEELIINLRALDCVTFYENCTVLARCIKMGKTTFDDYKKELLFLRYRDGKMTDYASRLHYTTDYWRNAEKKGIVKVVTKEIFGEKNVEKITRPINFMTTHRDTYRQIAKDDAMFAKIKAMEDDINAHTDFYLPKESVKDFADKIQSGNLIGIATNIQGMDISHTGVAIRLENGELHFMHAPNVGYKVQITDVPLHDYLARNKKQIGIIVARPNEV